MGDKLILAILAVGGALAIIADIKSEASVLRRLFQ